MFPTYNPNLPLSQQQYYPQRQACLQGQVASREEYSPNLTSPSVLDKVLGGAKTAPSSVLDFPMDDIVINKNPQFSSTRELETLWDATNGHEPDSTLTGFDLQMSRYVLLLLIFLLSLFFASLIPLLLSRNRKQGIDRKLSFEPLQNRTGHFHLWTNAIFAFLQPSDLQHE